MISMVAGMCVLLIAVGRIHPSCAGGKQGGGTRPEFDTLRGCERASRAKNERAEFTLGRCVRPVCAGRVRPARRTDQPAGRGTSPAGCSARHWVLESFGSRTV